jgi:hypothetical protein
MEPVVSSDGCSIRAVLAAGLAAHPAMIRHVRRIAGKIGKRMRTRTQTTVGGEIHAVEKHRNELLTENYQERLNPIFTGHNEHRRLQNLVRQRILT